MAKGIDWKNEGLYGAILGGIITVLMAFNVITAQEGTSLTASGTAAVGGILGLVVAIRGIVARYKIGKGGDEE